MNLHAAVRSAITTVNSDVDGVLRVAAAGYTTAADGTRTPNPPSDYPTALQVQPLTGRDIDQLASLNIQGVERTVYLNGNVQGLNRRAGRGGDMLVFPTPDGSLGVWLVRAVLEQWDADGWTKVGVTLQTDNAVGPFPPPVPPPTPTPSEDTFLTKIAQTSLTGHRAVKGIGDFQAGYPDTSVVSDAEVLLGVTVTSVLAGGTATIQAEGEMIESSWAWTPNAPVFCGQNGILTQTPDFTAAWLLQVGVALAPDRILIHLRTPVIL